MKHVLFRLAILLALATTATPAIADTVVTQNNGGTVEDFYVEVMSHEMRKERIVIDGPCHSACTLSLILAPKKLVCATQRAFFAFHRPYSGKVGTKEYEDDGGWSDALMALYPSGVASWISKKGGMTHTWILLAGDEMKALVPMCPEGTVQPDGEDRMLVPERSRRGTSETDPDARRGGRSLTAPQRAR